MSLLAIIFSSIYIFGFGVDDLHHHDEDFLSRLRERVVELEEELIGTQRSAGLPVR